MLIESSASQLLHHVSLSHTHKPEATANLHLALECLLNMNGFPPKELILIPLMRKGRIWLNELFAVQHKMRSAISVS